MEILLDKKIFLLFSNKSQINPEAQRYFSTDLNVDLVCGIFDIFVLRYQCVLKEMGIPDHLTCLLRNLYPGQEATVRTGHAKTDWFQRGKGVHLKAVFVTLLI